MSISDISSMSRYVSPINPAVFPHLTLVLMAIGLFFTAWFFVYEVSYLVSYCFCNLLFVTRVQNYSAKVWALRVLLQLKFHAITKMGIIVKSPNFR